VRRTLFGLGARVCAVHNGGACPYQDPYEHPDNKLTPKQQWTQQEAIALCKLIEAIAPTYGAHVALTGGTLYKEGRRKDCDLILYRIRQVERIDVHGLLAALANTIGLTIVSHHGWCCKGTHQGKSVDILFPECEGGEYQGNAKLVNEKDIT
jgi:hypothetical protein